MRPKKQDGTPAIYTCYRHFTDDFLFICHAMYEHAGRGTKGNKKLEMAADPTRLHDRTCLYNELASLSAS